MVQSAFYCYCPYIIYTIVTNKSIYSIMAKRLPYNHRIGHSLFLLLQFRTLLLDEHIDKFNLTLSGWPNILKYTVYENFDV